jgi:hypothetical protein
MMKNRQPQTTSAAAIRLMAVTMGPSRSGRSNVDDVDKRAAVAKRIRRGLHWVGSTSPGTTGFDVVGS